MQLELRTGHDDRAARIVDALAEQVLAEAALLALEHVGQRLQRTLVGAGDGAAAAAVVEQSVDSFLKHALFVADDDVRSAQLDEPLQAVVAVDDAAIEVVEIRRREAAAVQRNQRAKLRRNDRNDVEDHPLGTIAGLEEALDDLEPLDDLLRLQLGLGLGQFLEQDFLLAFEVEVHEDLLHGLGADAGREGVFAILVLCREKLVLGQQLVLLERGEARLENDIALEVQDALKLLQLHVEQQADAARQRLQEPDVRDGSGQLDVAHALAADLGNGHLDAALLADDALVLHALVLAAQAFVVLDRAEDARAEQAVTLRLERAVVDGLRLLDLAERPAADLFRARNADPDLVESLRLGDRICERRQFVHLVSLPLIPSVARRGRDGVWRGTKPRRSLPVIRLRGPAGHPPMRPSPARRSGRGCAFPSRAR